MTADTNIKPTKPNQSFWSRFDAFLYRLKEPPKRRPEQFETSLSEMQKTLTNLEQVLDKVSNKD